MRDDAGCLDDSAVVALLAGQLAPARRTAIEAHADGCERCRALIAGVVVAGRAEVSAGATMTTRGAEATEVDARGAPAGADGAAVALAVGSLVGRYRIVGALGRGGMASVYRAHDPELQREVAVKMVAPGPSPGARADERLQREAQALAQLAHPSVVRVFDVGVHGDAVFVAMELLVGRTLQDWLAVERPSPQRRLAVLIDIGRGLAAAHRAGLIHRDVKPSNVIVDDVDQPRLIDFGLARVTGAPVADGDPDRGELAPSPLAAALTEANSVVGTPSYMAPEQHRAEAVSAATDQFSFCVVAYEALFGQRPFAGATRGELRAAVLAGALRPPPARRGVERRVARALCRGLALDPAARHPSMDALLAALAPRRGRRAAIASIGVAGVAVVALVTATRGAPAAAPCVDDGGALADAWDAARAAAVRAGLGASGSPRAADTTPRVIAGLDGYAGRWRAARTAACRATHVEHTQSEALLDRRMACLDRRRAALAALTAELAGHADVAVVDRAVQAVAELPGLEPCADRGALLAATPARTAMSPVSRALADDLERVASLRTTGQYQRGLALAADVAARAAKAALPAIGAAARYELGALHAGAGDADAADRELEAAVAAAARVGDDALLARGWVELVAVRGVDRADHEGGLALALVADTAIARAGEPWRLRAALETSLGNLATDQGRFADARDRHRKAHALYVEHGAADEPGAATALSNLGNALDGLGDAAGAVAADEQALALRRRLFGDHHPHVAASLSNLATAVRTTDPRRALASLEEALIIARETVGARHVGVAIVLGNLGNVLADLGRIAEARARYGEALEVASIALAADHPVTAQLRAQRGMAALAAGDREAARRDLEQALAVLAATDTDPLTVAEARFALARVVGPGARGRSLAAEARAAYDRDPSPASVAQRAAIDAWLAAK